MAKPLTANGRDLVPVKESLVNKAEVLLFSPQFLKELGAWAHLLAGRLVVCADYSVVKRILPPLFCNQRLFPWVVLTGGP